MEKDEAYKKKLKKTKAKTKKERCKSDIQEEKKRFRVEDGYKSDVKNGKQKKIINESSPKNNAF